MTFTQKTKKCVKTQKKQLVLLSFLKIVYTFESQIENC